MKTKSKNLVKLKNELYSLNASQKLILAAGQKNYKEFVQKCDDPILLEELLKLNVKKPHFPSKNKIKRIIIYATFSAAITAIFESQEMAKKIKCSVFRMFLPTQQYYDL